MTTKNSVKFSHHKIIALEQAYQIVEKNELLVKAQADQLIEMEEMYRTVMREIESLARLNRKALGNLENTNRLLIEQGIFKRNSENTTDSQTESSSSSSDPQICEAVEEDPLKLSISKSAIQETYELAEEMVNEYFKQNKDLDGENQAEIINTNNISVQTDYDVKASNNNNNSNKKLFGGRSPRPLPTVFEEADETEDRRKSADSSKVLELEDEVSDKRKTADFEASKILELEYKVLNERKSADFQELEDKVSDDRKSADFEISKIVELDETLAQISREITETNKKGFGNEVQILEEAFALGIKTEDSTIFETDGARDSAVFEARTKKRNSSRISENNETASQIFTRADSHEDPSTTNSYFQIQTQNSVKIINSNWNRRPLYSPDKSKLHSKTPPCDHKSKGRKNPVGKKVRNKSKNNPKLNEARVERRERNACSSLELNTGAVESVRLLDEECVLVKNSLDKIRTCFSRTKSALRTDRGMVSKVRLRTFENERFKDVLEVYEQKFCSIALNIEAVMAKAKHYAVVPRIAPRDKTMVEQSFPKLIECVSYIFQTSAGERKSERGSASLDPEKYLAMVPSQNDLLKKKIQILAREFNGKDFTEELLRRLSAFETQICCEDNYSLIFNELKELVVVVIGADGVKVLEKADVWGFKKCFVLLKARFEEQAGEIKMLRGENSLRRNNKIYTKKIDELGKRVKELQDDLGEFASIKRDKELFVGEMNKLLKQPVLDVESKGVSFEKQLKVAVKKLACGGLLKEEARNVCGLRDSRNVDELERVRNVDELTEARSIDGLKRARKVDGLEGVRNVDGLKRNLEGLEKLRNSEELEKLRNLERRHFLIMQETAKELTDLMVFIGYKGDVSCYNFTDENMLQQIKTVCSKIKICYTNQNESQLKTYNLKQSMRNQFRNALTEFSAEINDCFDLLKFDEFRIEPNVRDFEAMDARIKKAFVDLKAGIENRVSALEKEKLDLVELNGSLFKEKMDCVEVIEKQLGNMVDLFEQNNATKHNFDKYIKYAFNNHNEVFEMIRSTYENKLGEIDELKRQKMDLLKRSEEFKSKLDELELRNCVLSAENVSFRKSAEDLKSSEFTMEDLDEIVDAFRNDKLFGSKKLIAESVYGKFRLILEEAKREQESLRNNLAGTKIALENLRNDNEVLRNEYFTAVKLDSKKYLENSELVEIIWKEINEAKDESFNNDCKRDNEVFHVKRDGNNQPDWDRVEEISLKNKLRNIHVNIKRLKSELRESRSYKSAYEMFLKQTKHLLNMLDNKEIDTYEFFGSEIEEINKIRTHFEKFRNEFDQIKKHNVEIKADLDETKQDNGKLLAVNKIVADFLFKLADLLEDDSLRPRLKFAMGNPEEFEDILRNVHKHFKNKRIVEGCVEKLKIVLNETTLENNLLVKEKHMLEKFLEELNEINAILNINDCVYRDVESVKNSFRRIKDCVITNRNSKDCLRKLYIALDYPVEDFDPTERELSVAFLEMGNRISHELKRKTLENEKLKQELQNAQRRLSIEHRKADENSQEFIEDLRESLKILELKTHELNLKKEDEIRNKSGDSGTALRDQYVDLMEKYSIQNSELKMQNDLMKEHIEVVRDYKKRIKESEGVVRQLKEELENSNRLYLNKKVENDKMHTTIADLDVDYKETLRRLEKILHEKIELEAEISHLKTQNGLLDNSVGGLRIEVAKAKDEKAIFELENIKIKEDLKKTSAILKTISNEKNILKEEIAEVKSRNLILEDSTGKFRAENKRILQEKSLLQIQMTNINEDLKKSNSVLKKLENMLNEKKVLEEENAELKSRNILLEDSARGLRIEFKDTLEKEIDAISKKLEIVLNEKALLGAELSGTKSRNGALEDLNGELRTEIARLSHEKGMLEKKISEDLKENGCAFMKFENEKRCLENEIIELNSRNRALQNSAEKLRNEIKEISEEKGMLEIEKTRLIEELSENKAVLKSLENVLREKKKLEDEIIALRSQDRARCELEAAKTSEEKRNRATLKKLEDALRERNILETEIAALRSKNGVLEKCIEEKGNVELDLNEKNRAALKKLEDALREKNSLETELRFQNGALEDRIRELKIQVVKIAEEKGRLEEDIKMKHADLKKSEDALREKNILETEIAGLRSENGVLEDCIEELKIRVVRITEERGKFEEEVARIAEEKERNFNEKNRTLLKKLEDALREKNSLEAEFEELKIQVVSISGEKGELEQIFNEKNRATLKKLEDAFREKNTLETELKSQSGALEELKIQFARTSEEKDKLEEKVVRIAEEKRRLEEDLKRKHADLKNLQVEVTELRSQNGVLEDRIRELKNHLARMSEEKGELEQNFNEKNRATLKKLEDALREKNALVTELKSQNGVLEDFIAELKIEAMRLSEPKGRFDEGKHRDLKKLEDEILELRSQNGVLEDFIAELKIELDRMTEGKLGEDLKIDIIGISEERGILELGIGVKSDAFLRRVLNAGLAEAEISELDSQNRNRFGNLSVQIMKISEEKGILELEVGRNRGGNVEFLNGEKVGMLETNPQRGNKREGFQIKSQDSGCSEEFVSSGNVRELREQLTEANWQKEELRRQLNDSILLLKDLAARERSGAEGSPMGRINLNFKLTEFENLIQIGLESLEEQNGWEKPEDRNELHFEDRNDSQGRLKNRRGESRMRLENREDQNELQEDGESNNFEDTSEIERIGFKRIIRIRFNGESNWKRIASEESNRIIQIEPEDNNSKQFEFCKSIGELEETIQTIKSEKLNLETRLSELMNSRNASEIISGENRELKRELEGMKIECNQLKLNQERLIKDNEELNEIRLKLHNILNENNDLKNRLMILRSNLDKSEGLEGNLFLESFNLKRRLSAGGPKLLQLMHGRGLQCEDPLFLSRRELEERLKESNENLDYLEEQLIRSIRENEELRRFDSKLKELQLFLIEVINENDEIELRLNRDECLISETNSSDSNSFSGEENVKRVDGLTKKKIREACMLNPNDLYEYLRDALIDNKELRNKLFSLELNKVINENKQLQKELGVIKASMLELNVGFETLNQEKESLNRKLTELHNENSVLKSIIKNLEISKADLQKSNDHLHALTSELREESAQLQHKLNIITIESKRSSIQMKELKDGIAAEKHGLIIQIQELRDEILVVRNEKENLEKIVGELNELKQSAGEKSESYKARLFNLNVKFEKYLKDQFEYQRDFDYLKNNLIEENARLKARLVVCDDLTVDFGDFLRCQSRQEQVGALRDFIAKRDVQGKILQQQLAEAGNLLEILINKKSENLNCAVKRAQRVVDNFCKYDEKYNEMNAEILINERFLREKLNDLESKKQILQESFATVLQSGAEENIKRKQ